MAQKKFSLREHVSSDNLSAIKPVIERIIVKRGTIKQIDRGFEVEAELEGESAQCLNRMFLSELRRVEKRTRIRTEWMSGDTIERFFDHVPKGTLEA